MDKPAELSQNVKIKVEVRKICGIINMFFEFTLHFIRFR